LGLSYEVCLRSNSHSVLLNSSWGKGDSRGCALCSGSHCLCSHFGDAVTVSDSCSQLSTTLGRSNYNGISIAKRETEKEKKRERERARVRESQSQRDIPRQRDRDRIRLMPGNLRSSSASFKQKSVSWVLAAHVCNPSFLGG
jgi:hypothetical protein